MFDFIRNPFKKEKVENLKNSTECKRVNGKNEKATILNKYKSKDCISKPEADKKCFYGVIGKIVDVIVQATEGLGEGVAIELMAFLSASMSPEKVWTPFGVHKTAIRCNGFLVAGTSQGKGISSSQLEVFIKKAIGINENVISPIFRGGISSPEGIIAQIRDNELDNINLPPSTGNNLLVVDEEISRILKIIKNPQSTLSNVLRTTYDGRPLEPLTKFNRIKCERPHVVIYGHITPRELILNVKEEDVYNGLLNRYPMYYSERKVLRPFPEEIKEIVIDELSSELVEILEWVNEKERKLSRSKCFEELWISVYEQLATIGEGDCFEESMMARVRHYATMYSMLFATLDKSEIMYAKHLEAALAWIKYWQDSVEYLFNIKNQEIKESLLSEASEKIFNVIKREIHANDGEAIGKSCITSAFSGKYSADLIQEVINELASGDSPKLNVERLKRNSYKISLLEDN
ncbi:hypothetical protein ABNJ92_004700 [Vibrio parahaemolyticus]